LYYRVCEGRLRDELLTRLEVVLASARVDDPPDRLFMSVLVCYMIGKRALFNGELDAAAEGFRRASRFIAGFPAGLVFPEPKELYVTLTRPADLEAMNLSELSHAHRLAGRLRDADRVTRESLEHCVGRNRIWGIVLYRRGLVLSAL